MSKMSRLKDVIITVLAVMICAGIIILIVWVGISSPLLMFYYLFNDEVGLFLINSFMVTLILIIICLLAILVEEKV